MTESRARSVTGAVSVIMKPLRMILNLGKGSALTVAQEWTERTVIRMADDLISRAAVVDAIDGVDWYHINRNGEMVHGANDAERQAWYKAEDIYKAVESVPSAQQWIPCKTAFPEKENTRVTYQTNAGVIIIDGIYGGIDAYGHRVWLDRERGLYWDDEVVAWMPIVIPEPWKGEKP